MTTATNSPVRHRPHPARAAAGVVAVSFALLAACGSSGYKSNAATAPTAAAGGSTAGGTSGSALTIDNFSFSPATLKVKRGAKVTVTNNDSTTHTWSSDSGDAVSWTSPDLSSGSSYSFTFTKAGTFSYHCKIHPSMTGTVVVS